MPKKSIPSTSRKSTQPENPVAVVRSRLRHVQRAVAMLLDIPTYERHVLREINWQEKLRHLERELVFPVDECGFDEDARAAVRRAINSAFATISSFSVVYDEEGDEFVSPDDGHTIEILQAPSSRLELEDEWRQLQAVIRKLDEMSESKFLGNIFHFEGRNCELSDLEGRLLRCIFNRAYGVPLPLVYQQVWGETYRTDRHSKVTSALSRLGAKLSAAGIPIQPRLTRGTEPRIVDGRYPKLQSQKNHQLGD